ncbi:MAG TPA: NAD(P)/FAD-dependent oxidoreductase [Ktedonobacteraceae bacterium]|jgi:thioredoxin reductase|nr:NAD(P)/FAD-dependent oxidoreductase [Ktedonobacteraceae bacterium]
MVLDCAIIGGGPAGLNATLVLGRARRKVVLFDDNKPRNAVTQHSHGFITRDGVHPAEFRAIGQQEIAKYPSVEIHPARIETVRKQGTTFELVANSGETFEARNILLATGIQEILPAVEGIYDYYGKSLFNCPFCDGWELRDKPLVLIVENEMMASHPPKLLYNWSHDLVVCTNGHQVLNEEQKLFFNKYGIGVVEDKIVALAGQDGQLERVVFENHPAIERTGGLVGVQWKQATTIAQDLGCETNDQGGIATDEMGHTNIKGVYAAGDTVTVLRGAQLIVAAANGSKAAAGVIADLVASYFDQ